MQSSTRHLLAAAVCGVLAAGCDSSIETPAQPTIAPASVTETFNGTVTVMNTSSHNFIVGTTGRLTLTLTAAGPPSTVQVGMGIGVPSGVACSLSLGDGTTVTVQASSTPQLSGTVIEGTFCVALYDPGTLPNDVAYTIVVAHP